MRPSSPVTKSRAFSRASVAYKVGILHFGNALFVALDFPCPPLHVDAVIGQFAQGLQQCDIRLDAFDPSFGGLLPLIGGLQGLCALA